MKTQKTRNFVHKAMIKLAMKSGVHEKSNKAKRRSDKIKLNKNKGF